MGGIMAVAACCCCTWRNGVRQRIDWARIKRWNVMVSSRRGAVAQKASNKITRGARAASINRREKSATAAPPAGPAAHSAAAPVYCHLHATSSHMPFRFFRCRPHLLHYHIHFSIRTPHCAPRSDVFSGNAFLLAPSCLLFSALLRASDNAQTATRAGREASVERGSGGRRLSKSA